MTDATVKTTNAGSGAHALGCSDLYRVYEDEVGSAITAARVPMLERFLFAIDEAIDLVGADTPGAHRLHERESFAFMQQEMDAMMERWRAHREGIALAEK